MRAADIFILPQGLEKSGYYVDRLNLSEPPTDATWQQLVSLKDDITEFKFGGIAPSPAQFSELSGAAKLAALDMSRFSQADQVISTLNSVSALERLNLHGPDLTDAGLAQPEVTRLGKLYLSETAVTANRLMALREAHPAVQVCTAADAEKVDAIEAAFQKRQHQLQTREEAREVVRNGTDLSPEYLRTLPFLRRNGTNLTHR